MKRNRNATSENILKKANSNSAPLLKLRHVKHELFFFVLQSTRKMISHISSNKDKRALQLIGINENRGLEEL